MTSDCNVIQNLMENWLHLSFQGVGIAQWVQWLGYRLNNCDLIPGRDKTYFSYPEHPDCLCGLLNL